MRTRIATAIATGLSLTATAAHAGQAAQEVKPCLSPQEVAAFVIVIAPPVIRETAKLCAPRLGAGSYLSTHGEALAARYEAENATAWPLAVTALVKLVKTDLPDPEMVKALLPALIGPALIAKVKPDMCVQIDRALGYLDPLPPRNTTGLLVQMLQLGVTGPRKSGKPFPICVASSN